MTVVLAALVVCTFIGLGALHVYWAASGTGRRSSAVPEVNGRPAFRPSRGATLAVAFALFAAAYLVAASTGWVSAPASTKVIKVAMIVLALVFLIRAIGDFRLLGFFKRVRGTAFARLDTLVFSPLCLLLAIAIFTLAWTAVA